MLSKFSVKKPYTVVVGVVLILILGFVSFTKMTTDLLPNINLPYALIMTTYPGASPETVEEVVTKPIEQAMATVSNIETVRSVSSENVSVVILQFAQTANMDSVSIEMRENIDQISGYWDDSVGKPIIMKLNPEMMPVMTAAVQKDGMEGADIAAYVDKDLVSDLESLEGVASVNVSGAIEESVQVIIRQDKIDAVNQKVIDALNGKFEDAQDELDEAKKQLEDGKSQLENGKQELTDKLAQASAAEAQILQGEAQIAQAEAELNAKEAELVNTKAQLEKQLTELQNGHDSAYQSAYEAALTEAYAQAHAQADAMVDQQIDQQLQTLNEQKAQVEEAIAAAVAAGKPEAEIAALREQLAVLEGTIDSVGSEEAREAAKAQAYPEAEAQAKALLDQQFPAQFEAQYQQGINTIQGYLKQMDEGQVQIHAAREQLKTTKNQLSQGKISLAQAQSQIESAKITATIEMAAAQAQLASGEAELEQGQQKLDDSKEQAYENADLTKTITSDMVSKILMAENFSMPAGYITEDGVQYLVRVGDQFHTVEEISDMVLFDMGIDGLEPICLSDVADVAVTDNSADVYAAINGQAGVLLTVQKQTGYSTGEVSDRINAFFEKRMEQDAGLHITNLMDQGIYIDMIVDSVLQNLLMGGVLAIIILFLFLKDIRPTAVIACSIPISVMTAVVLMYFSGVTLNVISLSGLALGVGMLVDNSVVVIENIYRLRSLGVSAKKAAVEGAKQVAGAITASTLTTVCVFLPIVFTEGITRQLFVDMGLTIGYSLLASLIVALSLVPMMSAGVLRQAKEKEHKWFDRFIGVYEKVLRKALSHKVLVLVGALVLLIVSFLGAVKNGTAFMPDMESTQMSLTAALDDTATVEETGAVADEIALRLMQYEDVEEVGAMVGSSGILMGGSESNNNQATVYVILRRDKTMENEELARKMEEDLSDLDCEISVTSSSMDMSALGGSGISVQIKGKELDTLMALASEVAKKVEGVEGTTDVSDGMEKASQELRVIVQKSKAMEEGLTVAQVYQQLAAQIAADSNATTLSAESKDYPVTVVNGMKTEYTREDIKNMKLTVTDEDGKSREIALADVAEFSDAAGPQSINREDQTRYFNVTAGIDADHNIGLVAEEVKDALKEIDLPEGYTIEMIGEDENINEAMVELMKMLALAVVFMYLIMVAQFQSLLSPFIVMFTIPLAFTGGFLGLLFTGMEVSVIAMIGFIMLSGVIVNNGIVLVDYVNQLRAGGREKREALVEAGMTRMRPIMMTALTTILGLSTLAFGFGMGSDMVQPMAVVTIGGLIYGTLLTLFVVPCIYDVLNRKEYRKDEEEEDYDGVSVL